MLRIVFIFLMLFLIPVVFATAAPEGASAPLPSSTSMNGITRAAGMGGVRKCLPRIEQVSNFITANTQSKFLMSFPPAGVDQGLTSTSFEVQLPSKEVAYATMSAAPTAEGGCDALYETVSYWSASCAYVAKTGFSNAKPLGVLQQHIMVLEGNTNLRVYLMPAGPEGCVAIKKEMVY